MKNRKLKYIVVAFASLAAEVVGPIFDGSALAAPPQFTQSYLRLDRHKALTTTGGTVCAMPATVATETDVQVTFPTQASGTDFTVNGTAANWTVSITNLPAGSTAWPGINTATNVTGKTVTFPSNDLTP